MNVRLLVGLAAFSLVACGGTEDGSDAIDADPSSIRDHAMPNTCPVIGDNANESTVHLATDDGVMLEADLYTTGTTRGPVAVLFHSDSATHDRSDYPRALIDALLERGISVLNVDRRGAGKSGGNASDALDATKGALDAKAAYSFLTNHSCAFAPNLVMYVGAEEGTTAILDFAVMASRDSALSMPRAIVYISGGTYTERNNRISANRAKLDNVHTLYLYSPQGRSWITPFKKEPSRLWSFRETERGVGTEMFVAPQSMEIVANFLRAKAG